MATQLRNILQGIGKLILSITFIAGLTFLYQRFTDFSLGWSFALALITTFGITALFVSILLIIRHFFMRS